MAASRARNAIPDWRQTRFAYLNDLEENPAVGILNGNRLSGGREQDAYLLQGPLPVPDLTPPVAWRSPLP